MSIVFDYPQVIPDKYTCPKYHTLCSASPICDEVNCISTVENMICIALRSILLIELPICCIKTGLTYAEVSLCLVLLQ